MIKGDQEKQKVGSHSRFSYSSRKLRTEHRKARILSGAWVAVLGSSAAILAFGIYMFNAFSKSPVDGGTSSAVAISPNLPSNIASQYALSWSDEFDGVALDMSKWNIGESWQRDQAAVEGGFPIDTSVLGNSWCPQGGGDTITLAGGVLNLDLKNEPKTLADYKGSTHTQTYPLAGCVINTRDKYVFGEGYLEARVKNTNANEAFTAFWLMGTGLAAEGWPKTGEVDIFEFVNNGTSEGMPFFTVHYGPNAGAPHYQRTYHWPSAISDYATSWHTYGLVRNTNELTVYIDGVKKYSMVPADDDYAGHQLDAKLFTSPMMVLFDMKSGGDWASNSTNTQPGIGTMQIDYVRAFDRAITTPTPTVSPTVRPSSTPTPTPTISTTPTPTPSVTSLVRISVPTSIPRIKNKPFDLFARSVSLGVSVTGSASNLTATVNSQPVPISRGGIALPPYNGDYKVVVRDTNRTYFSQTIRLRHPDLNRDGKVNTADLNLLSARINRPWRDAYKVYDLNLDSILDARDVTIIQSNWGK